MTLSANPTSGTLTAYVGILWMSDIWSAVVAGDYKVDELVSLIFHEGW